MVVTIEDNEPEKLRQWEWRGPHAVRVISTAVVLIFSYILFVRMIGDFEVHVSIAEKILVKGFWACLEENTYLLWHSFVAIFIKIGLPRNHAAALVTSLCNASTFLLVDYYFRKKLSKELNEYVISVLSLTILFVGPFYIPWYNKDIYLGQGSPNIWHNPTNLCVRPFAILSFILLTEIIKQISEGKREKKVILFEIVTLLVSAFAKPSWLQVFIPGVLLYIFIILLSKKGNKEVFRVLLFLVIISLIPILIMTWRIYGGTTISGETGAMYIAPLLVIKKYAPNVLISLLLGYFFPLYVSFALVIVYNKHISIQNDLILTWSFLIPALMEYILLAEKGREGAGNFGWGGQLMQFIIYTVSFVEYMKLYKENWKNGIIKVILDIGIVIYAIQVAVGVYFYSTYLFGA